MQKFLTMLMITLFGFKSLSAQNEIVYGSVRYDGFKNITKGAYWSSRPEAKMVYQGSYPPGVEVYELETDYFVRFIDSEHNSMDRNYIIFPKGQKVYTKNGKYHAAICGNQIEFMRPVDRIKIVEVPVKQPDPPATVRIKDSTVIRIKDSVVIRPAIAPQYTPQNLQTGIPKANPAPEQKKTTVLERILDNTHIVLVLNRQQRFQQQNVYIPPVVTGGPAPAPGNPAGGPAGVPGHVAYLPDGRPVWVPGN